MEVGGSRHAVSPPDAALHAWRLRGCAWRVVQAEGPKAVWRVAGPHGAVCLKRMRHPPDRCAFALEAQAHIWRNGGPVAPCLPSRGGALCEEIEGVCFAAFEWIEGRRPRLRDPRDRSRAAAALARFHMASRGYRPPPGASVSSKLGRWLEQYQTMIRQMRNAAEICATRSEWRDAAAIAELVAPMIAQAEEAAEHLAASGYSRWCDTYGGGLCHQDYGESNLLLDAALPGGACVVDLDGITFDVPGRDLRKLLLKLSGDGRRRAAAADALRAYQEESPLAPDELAAVWCDVMFPYEFHNVVKKAPREPVDGREARAAMTADRDRAAWARDALAVLGAAR